MSRSFHGGIFSGKSTSIPGYISGEVELPEELVESNRRCKCEHHIHIHYHGNRVSPSGPTNPGDVPPPTTDGSDPIPGSGGGTGTLLGPWAESTAFDGYPLVIFSSGASDQDALRIFSPNKIGIPSIASAKSTANSANIVIILESIPQRYWIRVTIPTQTVTGATAAIGTYMLYPIVQDGQFIDILMPFHVISGSLSLHAEYNPGSSRFLTTVHVLPP